MTLRALAALCAVSVGANAAQAAEWTGGTIDFNYSQFADDSRFSRAAVRGSAELGFTRNWATQLDLGSYNFDAANETGWNGTVHGIYHLNDQTSLGAYLGVDDIANSSATLFGVEAGYEFAGFTAEGYLGGYADNGQTATIIGGQVANALGEAWELNAGFDFFNDTSGVDLTRLSIGADYHVGNGAKFYGELGSVNVTYSTLNASEAYVGLGFRVDFGAERGATFGRRGLLDKIPGL